MATEPVTVRLGKGRRVVVSAQTRYTGTNIVGTQNIETYDVTICGVTVEGEWDGDARHNTVVYASPELVAMLLPRWQARKAAQELHETADEE